MKNFTRGRRELVAAGWTRRDRNGRELWEPPWNGLGFPPLLVTLATARRRLRRAKR